MIKLPKMSIVLILILFIQCKPYKVEFKEFDNKMREELEIRILKHYQAEDVDKSLITFTYGFLGDTIDIANHYETKQISLVSEESLGLSCSHPVNNQFRVEITYLSSGDKIILMPKYLKKYKYVYIGRNRYEKSKRRKYSVIYSNTKRTFK